MDIFDIRRELDRLVRVAKVAAEADEEHYEARSLELSKVLGELENRFLLLSLERTLAKLNVNETSYSSKPQKKDGRYEAQQHLRAQIAIIRKELGC